MKKMKIIFFLFIPLILLTFSCEKNTVTVELETEGVTMKNLKKLEEKSIFFGHKSVGDNILSGVESILKDFPETKISIRKVETVKSTDIEKAVILHSYIGENTKPISKFNQFKEIVETSVGGNCDIIFMKLCYVDITENTNPQKIFNEYKDMVEELKTKYPETSFVHLTVPLTSQAKGLKPLAKRILGKNVRGYKDNQVKEQYNTLLREEYEKEGNLFDLAYFESVAPDGKRTVHEMEGITYYSLVPEYTYDGGHLNEEGSIYIAEKLLHFLVGLN